MYTSITTYDNSNTFGQQDGVAAFRHRDDR